MTQVSLDYSQPAYKTYKKTMQFVKRKEFKAADDEVEKGLKLNLIPRPNKKTERKKIKANDGNEEQKPNEMKRIQISVC